MLNPKILLRVILLTLGIAAVVGAFGILFARTAIVGEIDATLVLTAICCAFLLRVAKKSTDQEDSAPLILSTALIAAEFIFGTTAIWSFDSSDDTGWAALETMLAIAGSGIPAVIFLKLDKSTVTRIAARTGLMLCAVALFLWVTAIVFSWQHASNWNFASYGTVLGGCGLLAVASLVGLGTDRWYWRWIGVVCATVACAVAVENIHFSAEWHTQPLLILLSISLVTGHSNISLRCPLKRNQRWLLYGTIGAVATACLFTNLAAPERDANIWDDQKGYNRIAGAAAVLGSCGTIALAILYRLNGRLKPQTQKALELNSLSIICPVCQKKQVIKNGSGDCPECGLVIHVQLDEPKCAACGYSLLMFDGDRCPECGAVLPHQQKTQEASSLGV